MHHTNHPRDRFALTARLAFAVLLASTIACLFTPTARAWHAPGHHHPVPAALDALVTLPEDQRPPMFLMEHAGLMAHCAQDPDLLRHPKLPQAKAAEDADHYLDLEYLRGAELPEDRIAFAKWCFEHDLSPDTVGTLPYALAEWTQRLAYALAEHRAWPDNEHIQTKCAVYAGILAHYAADACQPLHTTVHYDGKVSQLGADSPHTGFHLKVDALTDTLTAEDWRLSEKQIKQHVRDLGPIPDASMRHIEAFNQQVEALYALEPQVPAKNQPITSDAVREQTQAYARASTAFVASLLLTAWNDSAEIDLPSWHNRDLDE